MRHINSDEVWRQVPPEEKLELMARAHGKGLLAALLAVVVGATCAAALMQPWLLWAALLGSPLFFQYASGKAWRNLKPAIMLRYLAARSAARRYAFAGKSKDLSLSLLFRGTLERLYAENEVEKKILAIAEDNKQTEVWIALFEDIIVMMSEQPGGASLEFTHPVSPRLSMTPNQDGGYANRELILSYTDRADNSFRYKLTSPFPAALVVFEKQFKALAAKSDGSIDDDPADTLKLGLDGDDDDLSNFGYSE